jgi:AraC-like DNA-binding protein/quercetin dioxygenase-like cupin family protein
LAISSQIATAPSTSKAGTDGGSVYDQLERYTADQLLVSASQVTILRQDLDRTGVHWHDYYELVYVIEGTADHVVNGVPHPLSPGSLFLLTPADFHEIVPDSAESLLCYNVVIDPAALDGQQLNELLPTPSDGSVLMASGYPDAEADFRRLWKESREGRPGTEALMQALLRCILIEFARRCEAGAAPPRPQRNDSGIARAVLYVDHHFREPLTLADVAAQAHLSPNYFSERFRDFTGTSFQAYLQQRRLRFARSLLAATDLGVTEACHAAGFNSVSHFGRAYRRRYGQAPSAYRAGQAAAAATWPHERAAFSGDWALQAGSGAAS